MRRGEAAGKRVIPSERPPAAIPRKRRSSVIPSERSKSRDPSRPSVIPSERSESRDPPRPSVIPSERSESRDPSRPSVITSERSESSDPTRPNIIPSERSESSETACPSVIPSERSKSSETPRSSVIPSERSESRDPSRNHATPRDPALRRIASHRHPRRPRHSIAGRNASGTERLEARRQCHRCRHRRRIRSQRRAASSGRNRRRRISRLLRREKRRGVDTRLSRSVASGGKERYETARRYARICGGPRRDAREVRHARVARTHGAGDRTCARTDEERARVNIDEDCGLGCEQLLSRRGRRTIHYRGKERRRRNRPSRFARLHGDVARADSHSFRRLRHLRAGAAVERRHRHRRSAQHPRHVRSRGERIPISENAAPSHRSGATGVD